MSRSSSDRSDFDDHDAPSDDQPVPQPKWTTGWQRLSQTFIRPPGMAPGGTRSGPRPSSATQLTDYSLLTDDEKRQRIMALHPTERKVGYAAAALTTVIALIETVPFMVAKIAETTTTKPVGKHCPSGLTYTTHGSAAATCKGYLPPGHYAIYLGVYLFLALVIFVTVRIGRRSPVAFATALTGVAFGTFYVLVPFLLVGGWILLRSWRTQKYGAPTARTPLPGYTPPPGRGTRRTRSTASGKTPASGATAGKPRRAPEANKRYTPKTPPKPAKKRAPPSR